MPHLFIAITAHGYGHLAQVSPLAQALQQQIPRLRITLQSRLSPSVAKARMPAGYRHIEQNADVALPMDGPLRALWHEGLDLFARFDAEHQQHLARQRELLQQDPPDLLLADVPWLPLEAARDLDIPAVALCSLNWFDILAESPVGPLLPASLVQRMRAAYAGADLFLRPAPSMPMAWLPNARDIGPIAEYRPRNPSVLRARLGIEQDQRLALMLFGGAGRLCLGDQQPLPANLHVLTPDAMAAARGGRFSVIGDKATGIDLLDALVCCDVIMTKPGYGTLAEAACNGIPVLYVPRGDWPEEPYLVDWIAQQIPVRAVSLEDFTAGRISEPLQQLLDIGRVTPVAATGLEQAVDLLLPYLRA